MRKIEMHWECSSCRTRNLGRFKVCQHCGDPKDASEPWRMPDDTSAAPTITDPTLLAQANAGPDWQCGFCRSHQRRLDGSCANCGADQTHGTRVGQSAASPTDRIRAARGAPPRTRWLWLAVGSIGSLAITLCICAGVATWFARPSPRLAKPVTRVAELRAAGWTHEVQVERYRVIDEQGFVEARPTDAFDVRSLGARHHHDEQVFDHDETEHYTEQVPYQDTESYVEHERCGEDCTDTPPSCHEECSPGDNGFATCHQVCAGGGRSCTPRYCDVPRTRAVTRYRAEARTRQVPRYRPEPRFAEFFAWRAWRWRHDRVITASGVDDDPRWPSDAELAATAPLAEGEQERTTRSARYELELIDRAGGAHRVRPETLAAFERARRDRVWYVRVDPTGPQLLKPVRRPAAILAE